MQKMTEIMTETVGLKKAAREKGRWLTVLALFMAVSSAKAQNFWLSAGDLGFRFLYGKCVNEQGESGRNPRFLGECGEMNGADLSGEIIEENKLSGIHLEEARLSDANFHGGELLHASLRKAELRNTIFALGDVSRANFEEAKMRGASFYWTAMEGANLKGSDLRDADLRGASLQNIDWDKKTKFKNAVFDEDTWLPFDRSEAQKKGMIYAPAAGKTNGKDR